MSFRAPVKDRKLTVTSKISTWNENETKKQAGKVRSLCEPELEAGRREVSRTGTGSTLRAPWLSEAEGSWLW